MSVSCTLINHSKSSFQNVCDKLEINERIRYLALVIKLALVTFNDHTWASKRDDWPIHQISGTHIL